MMAKLVLDDAVGETRRALLDEAGEPFRLDLERWSERDARARVGEVWFGLVRARAPGGMGWFVDLGPGGDGLVEPGKGLEHAQGRKLAVRIKAEARGTKGPALTAVDPPRTAPPPPRPGRWRSASEDAFLHGVEVAETISGAEARQILDTAIEEALAGVVPLPGGGNISVETTRGLTAIDVDAGERQTGPGFAIELNREAAEAAARQMSLRGMGGLLVVDFLRVRDTVQRREIAEILRAALRSRIQRRPEVLEISGLGLCEALLPWTTRSVADAFARTPADEREALTVLRDIERVGWEARGARIVARVSDAAAAWLRANGAIWEEALAGRIGQRWTIDTDGRAPGRPDVAAV